MLILHEEALLSAQTKKPLRISRLVRSEVAFVLCLLSSQMLIT